MNNLSIFNNTGVVFNNEKRKSYTFVLNPNYGTGASYNSVTYTIDWASVMPDVPYYVHFSYMGETNNILGNTIACLYCDFGTPSSVYFANNAGNAVGGSIFVGIIKPYILSGSSYLLAEDNTNPPIYLEGRPRNNQITIQVLNNDNPPTPYAPDTGALAQHVIQLRFVPAELSDE